MRTIAIIVALLVVGAAVFSACVAQAPSQASRPDPVLPDLVTCGSDICWQDRPLALLTPEQVQADIKQVPGYEKAEITELWSKGGVALYGWNPLDRRFVQLVLRDDTPIVFARALDEDITLGRVIDQIGNPSHVLIQVYPNPELLLMSVDVIFESQGLIFHATPVRGSGYLEVSSSLKLSSYTLASVQGLGELLASTVYPMTSPPQFSPMAAGNDLVTLAQTWRGYVRYEVKFR